MLFLSPLTGILVLRYGPIINLCTPEPYCQQLQKCALLNTILYRHMTCPLHTTHNSSVQKRHCELSEHSLVCLLFSLGNHSYIDCLCWATPGGTAIPGRPVARAEQAPGISPVSKNQFNIVVARKPRIRY